ncbi:MAG: hypothetical protein ACLRFJ_03040 [Alphaproteobacteria bacterium]
MKKTLVILPLVALSACNTVAVKPHSLNTNDKIYIDTNGETMRYYMKEEMTKRGYNVTVGQKTTVQNSTLNDHGDKDGRVSTTTLNGARYVATVNEYDVGDYMRILGRFPVCVFNGWKWVDFNVSIADNKTGEEILYWSGMGCKNNVKNHLKEILDKLEK